jgi:hypothetical protein
MPEHSRAATLAWPAGRFFPRFLPPEELLVIDLRAASPDLRLSVTTLAGVVNRVRAQLYLIGDSDDLFWLQHGLDRFPQERLSATLDELPARLIERYRSDLAGLVIYDPAQPASINVATTLAGLEDGLVTAPALAESLAAKPGLPVIADLRRYAWTSRLMAYTWARDHLLAAATPRALAGMNPAVRGGLRSFLVAARIFTHWLDSRPLLPRPGERRLLKELLAGLEPGSVHLGWFIDEGSGVTLASEAGSGVLASDHCSNLEVWCSLPATLEFASPAASVGKADEQQDPPAERRVYVSFTMSDGDNLQYVQHRMLHLWHDPARGQVPIGWTIAPALLEAAPALAAYYMQTASARDELIAAPNGAAYMFPSRWPSSALPPFLDHSQHLMQSLQLSLLQILDGDWQHHLGLPLPGSMRLTQPALQQRFIAALAPHGLRGLLSGAGGPVSDYTKYDTLPIYHNLGLASSPRQLLTLIRRMASRRRERPLFLNVYILAWSMTPSDLLQAVQELGNDYLPITPGQLLHMLSGQ